MEAPSLSWLRPLEANVVRPPRHGARQEAALPQHHLHRYIRRAGRARGLRPARGRRRPPTAAPGRALLLLMQLRAKPLQNLPVWGEKGVFWFLLPAVLPILRNEIKTQRLLFFK